MEKEKNKLNEQNPKRLPSFSFIKNRKYSYIFSILLFVGFLIPILKGNPINWGIDFAGGIKIQVKLPSQMTSLDLNGAVKKLKLNATVQSVGTKDKNEYILSMGIMSQNIQRHIIEKYAPRDEKRDLLDKINRKQPVDIVSLIKWSIEKILYKDGKIPAEFNKKIDWQNSESVGPAVGSMLRRDGVELFLIASMFMIMYLTFRFEFKYSIAAMIALIHDLVIISFFVAVSKIEINIPVLAALLTLLGYSINDTIVIFDRIRENTLIKTKVPFIETIDTSIWQSMTRSVMTSLTTMVAVLAIILFGGEALYGFSLTLFFGIILGTYSSIFMAAPALYDWDKFFAARARKKPAPKNEISFPV